MSIRSVLKAGMLTHAGKKGTKKKDPVTFSRDTLGKLPPAAMHGILTAVVATSPEVLDCLTKAEMDALLRAYEPHTATARGRKVDHRTQLVGAISGHQEFECVSNTSLFLVDACSCSSCVRPTLTYSRII